MLILERVGLIKIERYHEPAVGRMGWHALGPLIGERVKQGKPQ